MRSVNDREPMFVLITHRPDDFGRCFTGSFVKVEDEDGQIGNDGAGNDGAFVTEYTSEQRQIENDMAGGVHNEGRELGRLVGFGFGAVFGSADSQAFFDGFSERNIKAIRAGAGHDEP